MKMKLIVLLIITISVIGLKAQNVAESKGVKFEDSLTWQQILAKASREKKFIFVDAVATWCSPCKQMEKMVFTSTEISDYANKNFVSVRLQIDSTKNDNEAVRKWYSVAHDFKRKYNIDEFPCFLFFLPSGEIVHRESGFHLPEEFLEILMDATIHDRQVYSLLKEYYSGKKNYQQMPYLAKKVATLLKDRETAFEIAENYNRNYFNKLNDKELLTKENIEFITWQPGALSSKDNFFKLFRNRGSEIDSITGQLGFAEKVIDGVISKEEIWDKIKPDGKLRDGDPAWEFLSSKIRTKYGEKYSSRNILNAKVLWYSSKKHWSKAIKYYAEKIEKEGIDTSFFGRFQLNNFCYDIIFKYSEENILLVKAANWIKTCLEYEPNDAMTIDTYAQLLYKSGQREEAIKQQQKAVNIAPNEPELQEHLQKMKNGEPTWVKPK